MQTLATYFPTLGFIGAGNMAGALLRGTVGRGGLPAAQVWACDVVADKLDEFARELGVRTTGDAVELTRAARTIVLAVKPQNILAVLDSIRGAVTPGHLLISIAAGVPIAAMAGHLPPGARLVRVMPNTPALVGMGAAGAAAGPHATPRDMEATLALLRSVGIAFEVEEKDLDAVTALSGSGPAYVFRCMEALIEAGTEMGLAPEVAKTLTLQTFAGAARLAQESADGPAELRRRVTSPHGTTAAALAVFEARGLGEILRAGVLRARDRPIELA
ncbi:MAG: pyrroline-5-carboxylate reductase, partial [bacterium]|nr:pyrroline-5-carboxylate reductase [bacterium]